MTVSRALLSEEDRKLIGATKKLMDELVETLDVMSSPEELDAIRESLRQVREGKVTSWDDYKRDLKAKGKL
jgi:PHD/YefM family antitoxin component YafN of YafNO toxin-antitoxin module